MTSPDHSAQDLSVTIVSRRLVIVTTLSAELSSYVNQRETISFVIANLGPGPASRKRDPDLHVAQGDLLVSDSARRSDMRAGHVDDP
jgi:hypothetical protein